MFVFFYSYISLFAVKAAVVVVSLLLGLLSLWWTKPPVMFMSPKMQFHHHGRWRTFLIWFSVSETKYEWTKILQILDGKYYNDVKDKNGVFMCLKKTILPFLVHRSLCADREMEVIRRSNVTYYVQFISFNFIFTIIENFFPIFIRFDLILEQQWLTQ